MGMLQDDETLTAAALQELAKVSVDIACNVYSFDQRNDYTNTKM